MAERINKTVAEFFVGIGLMQEGLENVAGFLTSNKGQDFHNARIALNECSKLIHKG